MYSKKIKRLLHSTIWRRKKINEQTKILKYSKLELKYSKLEKQEYLLDGDSNRNISSTIVKTGGENFRD